MVEVLRPADDDTGTTVSVISWVVTPVRVSAVDRVAGAVLMLSAPMALDVVEVQLVSERAEKAVVFEVIVVFQLPVVFDGSTPRMTWR